MSFGLYNNIRRKIYANLVKKKIYITEISLISMNCIGGVLYHDCNTKFLSPTINLFFLPKDFIKFVCNLEYYLSITPKVEMGEKYPIGYLDDIKIFFMHYNSVEDALNKWEERKKRVNKEKIFVIMVERDGFDDEDYHNFLNIKYPKILFTRNKKYVSDNTVYLKKFRKKSQLPDIIPGRHMYDKMRLVKEINRAYEKNGKN